MRFAQKINVSYSAKRLSTHGAQECSINGNNSAKRLSTYGAQEC